MDVVLTVVREIIVYNVTYILDICEDATNKSSWIEPEVEGTDV
jgi:hypothetical protein